MNFIFGLFAVLFFILHFQFKLCVKAFHIVLKNPSVFNTLLKDFPDMK